MSEGTNSAFSNGLSRENKKSGAGAESLSAIRPFWLAFRRTGGTTERAPRTVKSFVALSVRDKSSGSSPATIPHNSRHSNARARILPMLIRFLTICDCVRGWWAFRHDMSTTIARTVSTVLLGAKPHLSASSMKVRISVANRDYHYLSQTETIPGSS